MKPDNDLRQTWPIGTHARILGGIHHPRYRINGDHNAPTIEQPRLTNGDWVTVIGHDTDSAGERINVNVDLLGGRPGEGLTVSPAYLVRVADNDWPVLIDPSDLPVLAHPDALAFDDQVDAKFHAGLPDERRLAFTVDYLHGWEPQEVEDAGRALLVLARHRRAASARNALVDARRTLAARALADSPGLRGNSHRALLAGALVDHPDALVAVLEYLDGTRDDEVTGK